MTADFYNPRRPGPGLNVERVADPAAKTAFLDVGDRLEMLESAEDIRARKEIAANSQVATKHLDVLALPSQGRGRSTQLRKLRMTFPANLGISYSPPVDIGDPLGGTVAASGGGGGTINVTNISIDCSGDVE